MTEPTSETQMATATNDQRPPYGLAGLRADLVAGLTVAAVALPQGMAYALIAGVEPVYGLYTAVVMTALGSLFGSSAHLINGPTNAISLVVFSAIAGLQLADLPDGPSRVERAHQAVFLLSLLVGGLQILIYFFKLGDLTRYVSESVVLGFMVGAGLLVALTQLPNLLGLRPADDGSHYVPWRLFVALTRGGAIDPYALALGGGTAAAVVLLRAAGRRLGVPVPDMLLALVAASLVALTLPASADARPLAVPASLPTPHVPRIEFSWVGKLAPSALPLAVLGLLEALAIAKSIAFRTRQKLDYNWQCLAEGLANVGGGFFQCIPGSGSLTRSAINYQAGAVSRLSGIFSAAAVAVVVLAFADLARYVPRPALAGILLVTAWRLVDRARVAYCLRATSFDRWLLLATAAAAVFVSVEFSILIGVLLSFFLFVPRVSRLMASELFVGKGRLVRERQADDPPCGRLVLLGLEGQLFFGAAPELDQILDGLTARAEAGARVIVLRLKRTHNPDMVCLERMHSFLEDMHARGVVVLLCGVRRELIESFDRLGFGPCLPADQVFEETPASEAEGNALTSTLKAIKRAYELLGDDLCPACPRRQELEQRDWHYVI